MRHADGISPAWPIGYDEFEPWYTKAEWLYQVHGEHGPEVSGANMLGRAFLSSAAPGSSAGRSPTPRSAAATPSPCSTAA